jgi:hypothetical protein
MKFELLSCSVVKNSRILKIPAFFSVAPPAAAAARRALSEGRVGRRQCCRTA